MPNFQEGFLRPWPQVGPAPSNPGRNPPQLGRRRWENPRIRPRRNFREKFSTVNSLRLGRDFQGLLQAGLTFLNRSLDGGTFTIPVSELKTGTLRGTPLPPVSRRTFREKVLDRKLLTIGTRFPGPPEGRAYDSEPEFTRRTFALPNSELEKGTFKGTPLPPL